MAPLLRRRVALLLVLVLGALALPAPALADGRAILEDFREDGRIDRCYTRAEFREARELVRADQVQYGAGADVILDAQATNVAEPGEPCRAPAPATAVTEDDGGGSGLGLWIGVAVAVGVVAAGAGAWARRGASADDA